ncbi:unnamed protein product [Ectocarpus sp. CCAP 1310/34]|nr:unnamed protein product [Ectocarpus sp. CCAP 1310/34]
MQPSPSPIPIYVGDGCGQASYKMFWDGDPSRQSFISVVGLSSPQVSPSRPRPLSAPARGAYLSTFHSPRQKYLSQWSVGGFEVGSEQPIRSSSKQHAYVARERSPRSTHQEENGLGVERVPVLERMRENTCMRDAKLSIGDRKRLERLGQAQRRNLELIAALQTAKARAEKKARKAQDKVNTLQPVPGKEVATWKVEVTLVPGRSNVSSLFALETMPSLPSRRMALVAAGAQFPRAQQHRESGEGQPVGTATSPVEERIDNTARGGCVHSSDDGGGCSGDTRGYHVTSSSRHDTAPKVLLARETEAALRREQRVAAAKEKEEEGLRLSSSFRAKELHATNGPDWATIKAHQDLVRKQRTRDRAAFLAATSSLPARMAQHAAMQAVAEDRASANVRSGVRDTNGDNGGRGSVGGGAGTVDPGDIGRVMKRRQERRVFENRGLVAQTAYNLACLPPRRRLLTTTMVGRRKWEASLAAAKACSRVAVTRPLTPPMEKRRLAQEAKRREKENADQSAREAAANQRVQDERQHFQQLVEMLRATGRTFRETKASVRKAQEARKQIVKDLEEEKQAEFRERWRLNRSGLRLALRKRPNLLERQEKFAQQHSKRLADQAASAREFLESTEGFAAVGRRTLPGGGKGWMEKAARDNTFSSNEKAELGLPVLVEDDDNTKGASADGIAVTDQDFVFTGADKDASDSPGGDNSSGGDHEAPSGLRGARGDGEAEVAAEKAAMAEGGEMASSSRPASAGAGGSSATVSAQVRDGARRQEGIPMPGRGLDEESQANRTSRAETNDGSEDGSAGSDNTSRGGQQ